MCTMIALAILGQTGEIFSLFSITGRYHPFSEEFVYLLVNCVELSLTPWVLKRFIALGRVVSVIELKPIRHYV